MKLRRQTLFAWATPLLMYAADTHAWGLYTHLHFAQHLLLALPLLDPKFRQAVTAFPHLVLTGACLPDLALISKRFSTTHQWQQAEQMLAKAESCQELALAIGYTSHLYVDILAHNHFVPAFEAKWMHQSVVTHVVSEWAMDAHISAHISHRPFGLLRQHAEVTSQFVAKHFSVSNTQASHALKQLAWADKLLRVSGLSKWLLMRIAKRDHEFVDKLDYYLQQTYQALLQFEAVLNGNTPKLYAELNHLSATEMQIWREKCVTDLRMRLNTPIHAFHDYHEQFKLPI
jgi:Zinc dependent phospholipase C